MPLGPAERERYARHLVLKDIGGPGQNRLKAAKVLVVGAGGLGSPLLAYLAAAGVGTIGIADDDRVTLSNLQRQVIHTTSGIGTLKCESAAAFVSALNPELEVRTYAKRLTAESAPSVISDYDVIAEGTDSFASRAVLAAAAETAGKPMVSGAVSMFDGQLTVFAPHHTLAGGIAAPRFSDLYPQAPEEDALPVCEMVGVLGAVTGVIGTLMAMEVIKLITGTGEPLIGRLLLYDGRGARFSEFGYKRR